MFLSGFSKPTLIERCKTIGNQLNKIPIGIKLHMHVFYWNMV